MIRTIRRPSCAACASDSVPLYKDLVDGLYGAPGTWAIVRCSNPACRLMWLDPAPHPEDLIELYGKYFTHADSASRGLQRTLRTAHRVIEDLALAPLGIAAERRRARLMFLEPDPPGTLLDVGCGDGSFLDRMRDSGWIVAGVDFDAKAIHGIQERGGPEVHLGNAESMAATGRKFDTVTASHLIEHVPDPVKLLADCRRLLKDGGRVIIRTPNAASFGFSSFGKAWYQLDPPRHLCIFTRAALAVCGEKAGLKLVSCISTDANAGMLLAASYFLHSRGKYQWQSLSATDRCKFLIMSAYFSVRERFALRQDHSCGEELHAVFCQR